MNREELVSLIRKELCSKCESRHSNFLCSKRSCLKVNEWLENKVMTLNDICKTDGKVMQLQVRKIKELEVKYSRKDNQYVATMKAYDHLRMEIKKEHENEVKGGA